MIRELSFDEMSCIHGGIDLAGLDGLAVDLGTAPGMASQTEMGIELAAMSTKDFLGVCAKIAGAAVAGGKIIDLIQKCVDLGKSVLSANTVTVDDANTLVGLAAEFGGSDVGGHEGDGPGGPG
jgi:hypothetical protein